MELLGDLLTVTLNQVLSLGLGKYDLGTLLLVQRFTGIKVRMMRRRMRMKGRMNLVAELMILVVLHQNVEEGGKLFMTCPTEVFPK